jgi:hypothetical protein
MNFACSKYLAMLRVGGAIAFAIGVSENEE